VSLSKPLKEQWSEERATGRPSRKDLQRLGDEKRQASGTEVLVDMALPEYVLARDDLRTLAVDGPERTECIVVDGIRNLGEIDRLRDLFGERFTLIGVVSTPDARWDRTRSEYESTGATAAEFTADDDRDRNEESAVGQQVELCVDRADLIISNLADRTLPEYRQAVLGFADLVTGTSPRAPHPAEFYMSMAFAAAHGSQCLKRHVGAVVVDARGRTVGTGYNENPRPSMPCVHESEYNGRCHRDIVRNDHFRQLHEEGSSCPKCQEPLPFIEGPPWYCPNCRDAGIKISLETYFFPDRAMTWCTAVHAEADAILAAGDRAQGSVLYSTTFPCTQCAELIAQAGVSHVVFTEAYPDVRAAGRLDLADVSYEQFEGVRSGAYSRLFPRVG
jgi:deoxycytidylate deaminase